MVQFFMELNWISLILMVVLWLGVVIVALWMIDRLFPRMHRNGRDDHSKN